MDIVYVLGVQSLWQNKELYYSLLSVKKYLTGYRNIYIVGAHPGFEGDFIHIDHPDRGDKDTNIYDKTARACYEKGITDNFLFMNDDVFFCKPMHVNDIPDSYIGMLEDRMYKVSCPDYAHVLGNTYAALQSRRLPTKDFDGHMPIVYHKKLFIKATKQYNWGVKDGYAVKSIYFNTHRIVGELVTDLKIGKPETDIPALLKDRWCFSVGDSGLTNLMKTFLREFFEC
ncbi:MAG: hypothetical protein QM802_19960 [Agriterribacter sp.]